MLNSADLVNKLFVPFEALSPKVYRVDATTFPRQREANPMKYWGRDAKANADAHLSDWADTAALMKHADGQCGAWARFFRDVIWAQGGAGAAFFLAKIIPDLNGLVGVISRGFWVKNEKLTCTPPMDPTPLSTGIAGQGMPDPLVKVFVDHTIVKFNGMIYDPSYGKAYRVPSTALLEWQRASLDCVGFQAGRNRSYSKNDSPTWPLKVTVVGTSP